MEKCGRNKREERVDEGGENEEVERKRGRGLEWKRGQEE